MEFALLLELFSHLCKRFAGFIGTGVGDQAIVEVFPQRAILLEIDEHGGFLALIIYHELNTFHVLVILLMPCSHAPLVATEAVSYTGKHGSCFLHASPGDGLDLSQEVTELPVVDLHPVIQVEADTLVGVVAELLVKGLSSVCCLRSVSRSFSSRLRCEVEVAATMSFASWSRRAAIFPWSGITYSVRIRERVPS